jgi:hypothetical protein
VHHISIVRKAGFALHKYAICCGHSQGGVKLPTGGIGQMPGARERFQLINLAKRLIWKVSRSGAMPEPTV